MSGECPVCNIKVNLMTDEYKYCFDDNKVYHRRCLEEKQTKTEDVGVKA